MATNIKIFICLQAKSILERTFPYSSFGKQIMSFSSMYHNQLAQCYQVIIESLKKVLNELKIQKDYTRNFLHKRIGTLQTKCLKFTTGNIIS